MSIKNLFDGGVKMIFLADIAFALELAVLVLGTALLIFISKEECSYKQFGKVIAYFVIVTSIMAILCTSYYSIRYWEEGIFNPIEIIIHGEESYANGQKKY